MKSRHYIKKETKKQGEEVCIINSTILCIVLVLAEVADYSRERQIAADCGRLRCKVLLVLIDLLRQRLVGVYGRCHVSSTSTITSTITAVLPVYSRCLQYIRTSLPSLPYPMSCVIVSSCTPVSSLWNVKNWLYPAVKRLEALVSIITPINFIEVQRKVVLYTNRSMLVGNASVVVSVVITACLHTGIPWQDVISLLFLLSSVLLLSILPRLSCPGRASFSKTYLNRSSQLVGAVG